MQILIGIVLIVGGVGCGIYMFNKYGRQSMEMQYIETSAIADAMQIVDDMSFTDLDYHHYVELKGRIFTKEQVIAPFCEREVSYYENETFSVNEETRSEVDSKGNRRTRVVKVEKSIAQEKSSTPVFLTDDSTKTPLCVDIENFGSTADLQNGCDRFEQQGSAWLSRNTRYNSWRQFDGPRFLGYRLKEKILNKNQQMYLLGEMYKRGDEYFIGRAVVSKKPSVFTYKSEDQKLSETKSSKTMSLVIGGIAVVVGIGMIIAYFI